MSPTETTSPRPGMAGKLAIDLGPLLVFFLANAFAPVPPMLKIFFATGAFMVAMVVSMLVSLMRYRHISPMLWFSGAMVVVLGGITLWLHDETFIKMKPTIYYVVIAGLLLFGLYSGRNLLEAALGSAYPGLSERGWQLLTRNFALFFIAMAIANEAVWRNSSTNFWVGYKLWGAFPATILFALANVPMLMRHGFSVTDAKEDPPLPPSE